MFTLFIASLAVTASKAGLVNPEPPTSKDSCELIDHPLKEPFTSSSDVETYYNSVVNCGFSVFNKWLSGSEIFECFDNVVRPTTMFTVTDKDGTRTCISMQHFRQDLKANSDHTKAVMASFRDQVLYKSSEFNVTGFEARSFELELTKTYSVKATKEEVQVISTHSVTFDQSGVIVRGDIVYSTDDEWAIIEETSPVHGMACPMPAKVLPLQSNDGGGGGFYVSEASIENALVLCLILGLLSASLVITYQNCKICWNGEGFIAGKNARYKTVSMDSSAEQIDNV